MSSAHLQKFASISPAEIIWKNNQPYSHTFDDIYFSPNDGVAESNYVFIEGNNLAQDWLAQAQFIQDEPTEKSRPIKKHEYIIGELGFGSGLNFYNTVACWNDIFQKSHSDSAVQSPRLHYISIEKHPLRREDFIQISQNWPQFKTIADHLIAHYPSLTYGRHQIVFSSQKITLTLIFMPVADALDDLLQEKQLTNHLLKIDYWYLDGFAPSKNQSMWQQSVFESIAKLSISGTRLATFSVAAQVKKPLIDVGFILKKRKGFGRKREMLTATFHTLPATLNTKAPYINLKYERPWFTQKNMQRADTSQSIAIIGGGIAGCATAYYLTRQGYTVDLLEAKQQLAQQASGAAAGIFHPQLTLDMNFGSQLSWLGYLTMLQFLQQLSPEEKQSIIVQQGVKRYVETAHQQAQLCQLSKQLELTHWLPPSIDNSETRAIVFPHAAAINMTAFCQLLINKCQSQKLNILLAHDVASVQQANHQWVLTANNNATEIFQKHYDHIIYCGGVNHQSVIDFAFENAFEDTHISRGQTCLFKNARLSQTHQQVICEKNYFVPMRNQQVLIGSSFENFIDDQLQITTQHTLLKNTASLFESIGQYFPNIETFSQYPLDGKVGYRLHTHDRLPLVGGVIDPKKLRHDFQGLGQKRIRRTDLSHYNIPGLWLNTAYGSHGLTLGLIASKHITQLISQELSPLSQPLAQAIHPVRFIIQALKKRPDNPAY
ncbi:bifunctional tRNA (5-methylaminomethyl-2-thiouridine)(34)-methyltransferase MnmD/FAD-dependent 5-carboxymethylaminomethyl-2-thiouridine(34) oxidoreductase MnmC [Aliikangiella maris]|uniref:Bifunctional tRNA (5-methylaminomethyl-2-thiouridine)(34)-methyltransferase MnmD/FAD-dependent 5-carboxymethylaminomethyl-2-thiouridine(34) oxidoreductase MnmC n=2 Tax=Aliikangiella maris TaxID=3162458 RepID=A0ABV2BQA1_9GAMM